MTAPAAPWWDSHPRTVEERDRLRQALWKQSHKLAAARNILIECPCSYRVSLEYAFRCRHCGLVLCRRCADRHFGPGPKTWDPDWTPEQERAKCGEGLARPFLLNQEDIGALRWAIGRARANTSNLGADGEAEQDRRCNAASAVVDRILNLREPAENDAGDWIDCPEEPPPPGWYWWRFREERDQVMPVRIKGREVDGGPRSHWTLGWGAWAGSVAGYHRQIWSTPLRGAERADAEPTEDPGNRHERRISEAHAGLAAVVARLDDHNARITNAETGITFLEEGVGGVSSAHRRRLDDHVGRFRKLEERLDRAEKAMADALPNPEERVARLVSAEVEKSLNFFRSRG